MINATPDSSLLARLEALLGPKGFTTDAAEMAPWLVDWRGRVQGAAAAMLSPATTAETVEIMKLAHEAGVAVVPQGGNTSMVAGATPAAGQLLLSTRRLRAIRDISTDDNIAIVEAGVILSDLHDAAAAQGRRFPLSLGAKGSATIGGLVSTNAGGTQVLRFGTMRALVAGIEAVLPDGSLFEGLTALRKDNRGYDMRQLLSGAEGTLGVITAAALRLYPAVGHRAVAWVGMAEAQHALALLRLLEDRMGDQVEGFELIPQDALSIVVRHVEGMRAPLAGEHAWHVLVEATAPHGAPDPSEALAEALGAAFEAGLAEDAALASSEAQAEALWALRENISEAERHDGISVKHDVSVAVSAMPGFVIDATARVEAAFPGARVLAFGHLGDGNIHFNVRSPAGGDPKPWFDANNAAVSRLVHDLVAAAGGSLSAEHGIGQLKLDEFARLADPVRLASLRAIKSALDPKGIMNPGKLVPLASSRAGQ
jgi:FAD/FMN-containing dehydrogenase